MKDEWRWVPGYEGRYKVSRSGRVKSHITSRGNKCAPRLRRFTLARNGYLVVRLNSGTDIKNYGVHRLVALAFIPNPLNKGRVNHRNFNKTDNFVENLEWVTPKENTDHVWASGRMLDLHHRATLTEAAIRDIRKNYKRRSRTHGTVALGRKYGVTHHAILGVLSGETWRHVS